MKDEYIWLICIAVVIILGIIINIYKDHFTKWLLIGFWLFYLVGVIYCICHSFTFDKLNDRILWLGFAVIFVFKMYRNRYMIMKE
jgi:hypothetical protein